MSERDDSLYKLANLQEKPPRSARDLAVLEAAKAKAVMNKQKAVIPVKKVESFWSYLSKPMWLGTGSLAAAALSVFIVFGHQVAPEQKVASAPSAAPSPASDVSSNREEARSAPAISAKRDAAPPKKEISVQVSKQIATAEVNKTDVAKAVREPNVEVAAAPAPAAVADSVARKRESQSALVATNRCVLDIKAIPLERQTLAVESTKQLLVQCAQSVPETQWPNDIEWAKKLLDQQQEKPQ
jgi:hypothetical protein